MLRVVESSIHEVDDVKNSKWGVAMITFSSKGDFSKADTYFKRVIEAARIGVLDKYGAEGVRALAANTPTESGKTAASWGYEIVRGKDQVRIIFTNSNINKGFPVAIMLQYGHGTGTGGWVEGRDYINPAIQPVFDRLAADAWKEVASL